MINSLEKKAVIFDMDGVIIDSEPIHYQINNRIFKDIGVSISNEEYSTLVGIPLKEIWKKMHFRYALKQPVSQLVIRHRQRIIEYFIQAENLDPIPGSVELIKSLKDKGFLIAIASSTTKKIIEIIIDKLQISHLFDQITGGDQIIRGKPAPDIFLKTAADLGLYHRNCLVIEDSANGVQAAIAAGMKCIGFSNPNSGIQDITAANLIISDLSDLELNKIESLYD